jgi:hypothetical protein
VPPREKNTRDIVPIWLIAFLVGSISITLLLPALRRTAADHRRDGDRSTRQAIFDLVQPVTLSNCRLERFGEPNDGGYLLCANLLEGVAAGYSYGISGYDGWGCQIAATLRIPVHQYDCFDTTQPSCPDGNTIFHAECVADATKTEAGRLFDTIQNQFAKNGDAGKSLVVKMDVEGAEWDSFLHAPETTLQSIDQMAIEFHYVNDDRFVKTLQRLRQMFHVAHLHFNNFSCVKGLDPFPSWAYEVLLVNKRIAIVDETRSVTLPKPLDAPNDPTLPDCQLPRP